MYLQQIEVHYQGIFHSEFSNKFDIIDVDAFFWNFIIKFKKRQLN